MSASSKIVAYYSTTAGALKALVIHGSTFPELLVQASNTLNCPAESISVVYKDDENEPVSIGSQAELDEAFMLHNNHLTCYLSSCPGVISASLLKRLADPVTHPYKTPNLVCLWVVIPLLLAASLAVLLMSRGQTNQALQCSTLIQAWSDTIESGSISNNNVPVTSIYDLEKVCPQGLALYWIGRYEFAKGNVCDALEHFRSASKLNPSLAWSHFWTGRSLNWLDQPEDALKAFATAAHLAPYIAETQFEFGLALASADNVAKAALSAATEAVSIDPNHDEARLLKGKLAYQMGDTDLAYCEFTVLVARNPGSAEYRAWKHRIFEEVLQKH